MDVWKIGNEAPRSKQTGYLFVGQEWLSLRDLPATAAGRHRALYVYPIEFNAVGKICNPLKEEFRFRLADRS